MDIKVNGESKSVDSSISITDLLSVFKVEAPDMVSVQLNGQFVDRQNFSSTCVANGDEIDFLYFMGGGQ